MRHSLSKYRVNHKLLFYLIFLGIWLVVFFSQLNLYPQHVTNDLSLYQVPWWQYLHEHGFQGIATINAELYSQVGDQRHYADYTSIWYFIIVLFSKFGIYPNILNVSAAIKCIGAIFTLLSSLFAYLIVKHFQKGNTSWQATLAASLILFIPPFLGDLLKTNLPDSAYIALILLSLLLFLKNKYVLSWLIFGVAIYFKAMALYIAPLYIFYYLYTFKENTIIKKIAPIFSFVGLFIAALPGYFAGLTLWDSALGTILGRTASTLSAENGFLSLVDGRESFVNFPVISPDNIASFQIISMALMVIFVYLLMFLLFQTKSKKALAFSMIDLTIVSPIILWFFLPGQHENYFSIAAVFAFLALLIVPTKKYFVLFIILNFLVWQSYHFGPKILFNPYLFVLVMIYFTWEIFKRSDIQANVLLKP